MPSFSLIGALEFRRVVSSLQHDAATTSLNLFDTPISPYPGGHYHQHTHQRVYSTGSRGRSPGASLNGGEARDPWDAALAAGQSVPLEQRSPRVVPTEDIESGGILTVPDAQIPVISHTPASPSIAETATETSTIPYIPPTRRHRFIRTLSVTWHVLFPTLHNFRSKSFLGMIAAVFAAPAVMALTLTLPVVVTDHEIDGSHGEKLDGFSIDEFTGGRGDVGRLVDFEEEGVGQRTLVADEIVDDDEETAVHELKFNKFLMAVQCTLGPLFCVSILFGTSSLFVIIGICPQLYPFTTDGAQHEPWILLAAGVAGTAIGILVAVFSQKGEHPTARLARCTMGFIVAIVWIMAIADEVVAVLQVMQRASTLRSVTNTDGLTDVRARLRTL